jgi:proton-translocating NADH-quinone oxidoreductase chain M
MMNMSLGILLATPFVGGILAYLGGKIHRWVRYTFAIIFSLITLIELFFYYNASVNSFVWGKLFGSILVLRINPISWLFAFIVTGISLLVVLFSVNDVENHEGLDFYYLELLFVEGAMLGITLAGDLLTFFLFWEMMSWTSYILIIQGGRKSITAGYKYIIMSIIGAYSMLTAIGMIFGRAHSFVFSNVASALQKSSPAFIIWFFILFGVGLLVKAAVMPLHTWLPDAHSEAPSPVSPLLSGVLIKMGAYGLFILFYGFLSVQLIGKLIPTILPVPLLLYIVQWLAAISIVLATFLAIMQEDAKRLLAYSSISQIGYVVLGLAMGSSLGVAGGLFHALNHAIFKSLLFFTIGAVIYRTGTRNMSELGGLIKRMPITFTGALIGIIALAGVPPLNGFVSKWMIYEALLQKKEVFLLIMAFVGSTGAFLYLYRFIHSVFLGQLPEKYKDVKEVPFLMQLPIWILSLLAIVYGIFPGLAMDVIARGEKFFGIAPVKYNLYGFPQGSAMGALKVVNISSVLIIAFVVVLALFFMLPRARKLSQYDTVASGQVITPETKYNYSYGFYMFFGRVVNPFFKWSADKMYEAWGRATKVFGDYMRRVYTGNLETYSSYIVVLITIIAFVILIGGRLW